MKIDDGHNWLIWAVQENLKTCKLLCKASSSNQLAFYEELNSLPDLTRQSKPCNVEMLRLPLILDIDVRFDPLQNNVLLKL